MVFKANGSRCLFLYYMKIVGNSGVNYAMYIIAIKLVSRCLLLYSVKIENRTLTYAYTHIIKIKLFSRCSLYKKALQILIILIHVLTM